ncbi:MAG: transaldolase [Planctomycetota bacterium]|nr:transaldolase [Planctomycetota bacterium]MDA1105498.1 transaldolase [Planctomycetota bacterium]
MANTSQLALAGQSIWLDNITRALLDDGTIARYIAEWDVVGLTSNPTIFDQAISKSSTYDAQIRELAGKGMDPESIFFALAIDDLRRACDLFAPVHRRTGGMDGWVSLEVSPKLAYDTASTVKQALALHAKADRPNLFIKVPGTPEGLPAVEQLAEAGVPVNVTLLFDAAQYRAAANAWNRGIAKRLGAGKDPVVHSVASVFVSRWEKPCTAALQASGHTELKDTAGIAAGRRCWEEYVSLITSDAWRALAAKGATPQRLLFASTSTKDPALSPTMYVDALAAPNTVNTMPDGTLKALAQNGSITDILTAGDKRGSDALAKLAAAGIDLKKTAAQLQSEGAASFVKSWDDLICAIAAKASSAATA